MADPRPLHQEPRHHPFSVGQADAGVLRLRQALARRVQQHHHPGEQRRRRELGQPASGGGGADRPGRGALADPAAEPPAQRPAGDRVRPRRLPLLPHRPPFGSVDLVQRRRGRHLERAPPHHHPRHRAGPGGGAAGRGADHHHRGGAAGDLPQPGRQPRHPCLGRRPDRYLVPSRRRALRRRGAARRGRPAHRQPSARRHPLPAAAAGEPAQRHPAGGAAAGGRAPQRAAGHAARQPGVVPRVRAARRHLVRLPAPSGEQRQPRLPQLHQRPAGGRGACGGHDRVSHGPGPGHRRPHVGERRAARR